MEFVHDKKYAVCLTCNSISLQPIHKSFQDLPSGTKKNFAYCCVGSNYTEHLIITGREAEKLYNLKKDFNRFMKSLTNSNPERSE